MIEKKEPQSENAVSGQNAPTPRSLHTPGPWTFAKHNGTDFGVKSEICPWIVCDGDGPIGGYSLAYVLGDVEELERSCEANARLIAAAPELLAACKALPLKAFENEDDLDAAQFVDECNSFLTAMRLARAALAKAEGASSVPDASESATASSKTKETK